jgi:hypothetical protein
MQSMCECDGAGLLVVTAHRHHALHADRQGKGKLTRGSAIRLVEVPARPVSHPVLSSPVSSFSLNSYKFFCHIEFGALNIN